MTPSDTTDRAAPALNGRHVGHDADAAGRLAARVAATERELTALRDGLLDAVNAAVPVAPARVAEIAARVAEIEDPLWAEEEWERLMARERDLPVGTLPDGDEPPEHALKAYLDWVKGRAAVADRAAAEGRPA